MRITELSRTVVTRCICVGQAAYEAGLEATWDAINRGELPHPEELTRQYEEAHPDAEGLDAIKAAIKITKPLSEYHIRYMMAHPLWDKPDPDCPFCKGTGEHRHVVRLSKIEATQGEEDAAPNN